MFELFYTLGGSGMFRYHGTSIVDSTAAVGEDVGNQEMVFFPPQVPHAGTNTTGRTWRVLTLGAVPRAEEGQKVEDFLKVVGGNVGKRSEIEGEDSKAEPTIMSFADTVGKPMKDNVKIHKRVLLGNNKLPNTLMFAESTLPKGERNPKHVHKDAYEVFCGFSWS